MSGGVVLFGFAVVLTLLALAMAVGAWLAIVYLVFRLCIGVQA